MKTSLPRLALLALLLAQLAACKTKTYPRPLADLNAMKGRWVTVSGSYEFEIDPAARTATFTKVPAGNAVGFKAGEMFIKNLEGVDETTYRGEIRYRTSSGYYYFADIKLNLAGDELIYTTDSGSNSGSLTISGQTGKYKRVP